MCYININININNSNVIIFVITGGLIGDLKGVLNVAITHNIINNYITHTHTITHKQKYTHTLFCISYLIAQMLSCFSWSFYGYSKPCICIHFCMNTKSLKNKELFTHQNKLHTNHQPNTRPSVLIFTLYSAISQSNKQESQQLESV